MKKFLMFTLIGIFTLLSACSNFNQDTAKSMVKNEVEDFYEHLLLEDLDRTMKQISSSSEQYYQLYDEYRDTFQTYDYSYNLKEISFNELSKDHISVTTSVIISGVNENDEYDSYEVVQVFVFKPLGDNGWKISSLETKYDIQ